MKIIKLPEVIKITTLSRSSIYALAQQRRFPAPIKLSERAVGWLASDVEAWLNERAANRAGAGAA